MLKLRHLVQTLLTAALLAAVANVAVAFTYQYNILSLTGVSRFTWIDNTHFKEEWGDLFSDGFVPSVVSTSSYFSTDPLPSEVQRASGLLVFPLANWKYWQTQEIQADCSFLGNFQRSSEIFYLKSVPYVVVRWKGGGGTFSIYEDTLVKPVGLLNMSFRAVVPLNGRLIPGWVLSGTTKVLIRAGGPGLAKFGVTGTLENPKIRIFKGTEQVATNDDWSSDTITNSEAWAKTGAFAYEIDSKDASIVLTLDAGAYTAYVEGDTDTTGEVLFELYSVAE